MKGVKIILFWTKIINVYYAPPLLKIDDFVLHNQDVKFVKIILYLQKEIMMFVKLVQQLIHNVQLAKMENVLGVTKDLFLEITNV